MCVGGGDLRHRRNMQCHTLLHLRWKLFWGRVVETLPVLFNKTYSVWVLRQHKASWPQLAHWAIKAAASIHFLIARPLGLLARVASTACLCFLFVCLSAPARGTAAQTVLGFNILSVKSFKPCRKKTQMLRYHQEHQVLLLTLFNCASILSMMD